MSKKFTEKQYQKIVDAWNSEMRYVTATKSVSDYLVSNDIKFMGDKALAIANPLTREWAHEQYVEKEKKYVWQSKQETNSGEVKRLYDSAIGITDSFKDKTEPIHNGNLITETEVKKWGYNIEMFDKEEV